MYFRLKKSNERAGEAVIPETETIIIKTINLLINNQCDRAQINALLDPLFRKAPRYSND